MLECRLALGRHALSVGRFDLDEVDLQPLGDLPESRAARTRVIDAVVQILHLAIDALAGNAVAELILDLIERALLAGGDVCDAHDHRRERARHRLRDLSLLELESGVGNGRIDHLRLGEGAEVDVAFLELEPFQAFLERRRSLERSMSLLGSGAVGERDLLDMPALGRRESVLLSLVKGLHLLVADGDLLAHLGIGQQDERDLPELGRNEAALVLLVVRLELFLVGGLDLAGNLGIERHVRDGARLALVAVKRLDEIVGRHIAAGERLGELLAHFLRTALGEIAPLGEIVLTQDLGEGVAVELTADAVEHGIIADGIGNRRVRQIEAELLGVRINGSRTDEARDDALVDAELARLIDREAATELTR